MELRGRRVGVLVEDLYEDLELWYPTYRLREAGAEVVMVGPAQKQYVSKHGYPAKADVSADKVKPAQFDAVIIPGGYAPDRMRRHSSMVNLVREAVHQGKVVGAICHGPWMLSSANVLAGRHVTSFAAIKDDLVHAGAGWEDAEVVQDENIITSRMPGDLPAFCRAIIAALAPEPKD